MKKLGLITTATLLILASSAGGVQLDPDTEIITVSGSYIGGTSLGSLPGQGYGGELVVEVIRVEVGHPNQVVLPKKIMRNVSIMLRENTNHATLPKQLKLKKVMCFAVHQLCSWQNRLL